MKCMHYQLNCNIIQQSVYKSKIQNIIVNNTDYVCGIDALAISPGRAAWCLVSNSMVVLFK